MKYRWDKKYLYWGVTIFLILAAGMALATIFFQWQSLLSTVNFVWAVHSHFLWIIIAFLLNPIVKFFDGYKGGSSAKRSEGQKPQALQHGDPGGCGDCHPAVYAGDHRGIVRMVIPALIESISRIFSNLNTYYTNLTDWLIPFPKAKAWFPPLSRRGWILHTSLSTTGCATICRSICRRCCPPPQKAWVR